MTNEIRRLVDLDEPALARVPFGRNRFLRVLGIALFGSVVRLLLPQSVQASHASPPYPCYGYHPCSNCNGTQCSPNCENPGGDAGCDSGGQCWWTCMPNGLYRCCDWEQFGEYCICSSYAGPSC